MIKRIFCSPCSIIKRKIAIRGHPKLLSVSKYHFTSSSSSPLSSLSTSAHFSTAVSSSLPDIKFKSLKIEKTKKPKPKLPNDKLLFGKSFTDHMFEIDWDNQKGWGIPKIIPYAPFQIDPACSVFHYALEAFEGLKAYKDKNNKIRLFRPDQNAQRLLKSCQALYFFHHLIQMNFYNVCMNL